MAHHVPRKPHRDKSNPLVMELSETGGSQSNRDHDYEL